MSYYQAQDVRLPKPKSGTRRWIAPLCFSVAGVMLGIAIGAASASDTSGCEALADEYAVLVSKGIDAGLSGDEEQMLDIAAQRDTLSERVKNNC